MALFDAAIFDPAIFDVGVITAALSVTDASDTLTASGTASSSSVGIGKPYRPRARPVVASMPDEPVIAPATARAVITDDADTLVALGRSVIAAALMVRDTGDTATGRALASISADFVMVDDSDNVISLASRRNPTASEMLADDELAAIIHLLAA